MQHSRATVKNDGLEFVGVTKSYGDQQVLNSLHLKVQRGEFLTLLGPSGSGKTTTLMIAAGLTEPSGGHVTLQGRDITHVPPHKRNIGVVFQNYALFPHRTALENIAYPLKVRGISREAMRRQAEEALGLVQLKGLGGRYPRELSGGQQQRVALARALVFEPSLVLMDEPLGALDKKLRLEMQIEIKRLHEELALTILYVTHDQEEALAMSDSIAVMRDGGIEQLDTPTVIYEHPKTEFVATFLGDTNILRGVVAGEGPTAQMMLGDGEGLPMVGIESHGLLKAGSAATAAVHCCKVLISSLDAPTSGRAIVVTGVVEETIYRGMWWLIGIRLASGQTIRGIRGEEQGAVPRAGERVVASWTVGDMKLLGMRD